ncbi:hypothetical protein [Hymenobacter arizonensis]|uniref:PsbP C-terminal domain-containing protein n=1 Tax=Hymenobacter arizonensis TaxID=1227077 RepID=A0A1I5YBD1_HYMAR|nr:hypothetical protein [Hymenobacter arizonensis]SFQ41489.1 hypothetical protein SAMN04515668_2341 [Hymenobacter arizonensis]
MLRFLFLLLFALPAVAQKYNAELATPPTGFTWQALPEIKGAMLLPEGWYFKPEGQKDANAYFLTLEEIVEGGEFQTGITINVNRKLKAKTGLAAPNYAKAFSARGGIGPNLELLEKQATVDGPFHKYMVRYRAALPDADPKIIYQLAIGNAKTDTLYTVVFESPEKDWTEAWKLGEVMLKELVLDSRQ